MFVFVFVQHGIIVLLPDEHAVVLSVRARAVDDGWRRRPETAVDAVHRRRRRVVDAGSEVGGRRAVVVVMAAVVERVDPVIEHGRGDALRWRDALRRRRRGPRGGKRCDLDWFTDASWRCDRGVGEG